MKRIIIIVLTALIIASCNNKGNNVVKQSGRDTTITVVAYSFNWDLNDHRFTTALRIEYDTLLPNKEDSTENIWQRDTLYKLPFEQPVLDSITKKPVLDTTGTEKKRIEWLILPREFILVDYNKRFN